MTSRVDKPMEHIFN